MKNKLTTPINHQKIGKILFETSSDMLAILDSNGKILDCNEHLEKNTNYKKNELIGLIGPVDLVFDEDIERALSAFEELKITNKKQNIPLRLKRKDESIFPSIWSGATLRDESNNIEGYIVTGKDLSEIQSLKNELLISKKQHHQEKFALVGQLTGNIAHELRNPLAIIKMTLENLKLLYGSDDIKEKQFDKVDRSIGRIVNQINEILDFVREKPIVFEKILFSKVLFESLDSIKLADNIKMVLPKIDVEINCEMKQFATVLNNLILNGIQSISGKGLIAISVEDKDDKIIIEIEDSGKGIPKKDLSKIFQPLYTTKQHGTGLGLVSVKSIIKAHGGSISVKSPPTIFKIELPKN